MTRPGGYQLVPTDIDPAHDSGFVLRPDHASARYRQHVVRRACASVPGAEADRRRRDDGSAREIAAGGEIKTRK